MEFKCASCEEIFKCANDNMMLCHNRNKFTPDGRIWCICKKCFDTLHQKDPTFFKAMCPYWNDNPSVRI